MIKKGFKRSVFATAASVLLAAALYAVFLPAPMPAPLCLQVIANSDSAFDQAVKLTLRDTALAWMTEDLSPLPEEKRGEALEAGLPELEALCRKTLDAFAADEQLSLDYRSRRFAAHHDAAGAWPAGSYPTRRITIGEGKGHNWWGVVFAPAIVPAGTASRLLTPEETEDGGEGARVIFASRLAELWQDHRSFP